MYCIYLSEHVEIYRINRARCYSHSKTNNNYSPYTLIVSLNLFLSLCVEDVRVNMAWSDAVRGGEVEM